MDAFNWAFKLKIGGQSCLMLPLKCGVVCMVKEVTQVAVRLEQHAVLIRQHFNLILRLLGHDIYM